MDDHSESRQVALAIAFTLACAGGLVAIRATADMTYYPAKAETIRKTLELPAEDTMKSDDYTGQEKLKESGSHE